MALVFALGIMAGRALAAGAADHSLPAWSDNNSQPAASGSSLSAASGGVEPERAGDLNARPACATCTLPASGQAQVSGPEAPAGAAAPAPAEGANSAPSLPLAPEPNLSCH
jgi:hypothetical protein